MRLKQLAVERVLLGVGRDSSGANVSREATAWAGRIGDKAEPKARGAEALGNQRR